MSDTNPAGWYQDPTAQSDARYWNGASWTQSVNRGGVTTNVAIDPSQAQLPPAPGTQVSVPPPPTQSTGGGSAKSLVIGLIVAILIGALVYALVINDSSDSPTPSTDTPATTAAPAEEGG